MKAAGYVRFVTATLDRDSGRRRGLFWAMSELKFGGTLSAVQLDHWEEVRGWFERNLERPERLARSTRAHAKSVAISWFKDTAVEHIQRMHEIVQILREHGIEVDLIRTERPGFIVYEDDFQVAAEPFADTLT